MERRNYFQKFLDDYEKIFGYGDFLRLFRFDALPGSFNGCQRRFNRRGELFALLEDCDEARFRLG